MNQQTLEKIVAAQKSNAAAITVLVQAAFDSMEKLAALNIHTSRNLLNHSAENMQAMLQAKDLSSFATINRAMNQPGIEEIVSYSQALCKLLAQTQEEISALVRAQYASLAEKVEENIEKTAQQSPIGSDVFASTMRSILNASNAALGHLQSTKLADDQNEAAVNVSSNVTARKTTSNTNNSPNKRR